MSKTYKRECASGLRRSIKNRSNLDIETSIAFDLDGKMRETGRRNARRQKRLPIKSSGE